MSGTQNTQSISVCLLIVCGVAAPSRAVESSVSDIGSRRELFVDNHLIDSLKNARRQLHHPVPGEIAITHDASWEGSASNYHSVIRDGDRYRLFYRGSGMNVAGGKLKSGREVFCCAESDNGILFAKPTFAIHDYEGNNQNNILWVGVGTHNFAPFLDSRPGCSAQSRYKALGGTATEGGLFAFHSPDGIHWSLMRDQPVVTKGAFDSQNLAFWDSTAGAYRAYFRTFTAGETTGTVWKPQGLRAIKTALSRDFLVWDEAHELTYNTPQTEHLYTNQIAPYGRAPHLLIGFPTRYVERGWSSSMRALPDLNERQERAEAHLRYGTALTEGLIMASRDGVRFERWDEAFLRPGAERPNTWLYGHQFIAWNAVETRSHLPGAANEVSLYATEGTWNGRGTALRRYTLRLDGFVSVNAELSGGELLTKPLQFTGTRLKLNAATSAAGDIRIEFQEVDGRPISGLTLDDCDPIFGDFVDRDIVWKYPQKLASVSGRPIRLRFVLRDADLFSFKFE